MKTKYYIIRNCPSGVKWLWDVKFCTEREIKERVSRYNSATSSGVFYTYTTEYKVEY